MGEKLYPDGMPLEEKLMVWYETRKALDLIGSATLHENTPLLKEAVDAIEMVGKLKADLAAVREREDALKNDIKLILEDRFQLQERVKELEVGRNKRDELLIKYTSQIEALTARIKELEIENSCLKKQIERHKEDAESRAKRIRELTGALEWILKRSDRLSDAHNIARKALEVLSF